MSRRQHRRRRVSVVAGGSYGPGRAASSSRRGRVGSLVLAGLAAAAVSSGCTTSDAPAPGPLSPLGSGPPPSQSVPVASSPTPSGSPTVSDEDAIRAAYATFMDARNVSLNDPRKPPDRRLWQVSIPPARDELYSFVLYERARHVQVQGATRSAVTNINIDHETAALLDCLDSSDAIPVKRTTGESVLADGQSPRIEVAVDLKNVGERWWVWRWMPKRDKTC